MTKLKVCDISEGASRVERGTLCVFVCVCVCVSGTLTHTHMYVHSRIAVSYPNGPCTDLIWSSSEEVLQLQGCVAGLDDLAQGTDGEKFQFESRGLNCLSIIYCHRCPDEVHFSGKAPFIPI